jgi:hypothetical protein
MTNRLQISYDPVDTLQNLVSRDFPQVQAQAQAGIYFSAVGIANRLPPAEQHIQQGLEEILRFLRTYVLNLTSE